VDASTSTYVTIGTAAVRADIPEGTLRRWIAAGALPAKVDAGEQVVRLEDVWRLLSRDAPTPRVAPRREEGAVVVTGTAVEPARHLAPARPEGLALIGALVGAMIGKLDDLYGEALTAKDNQLAAKDDLIVELRGRIERAERGLAAREHAPPTAPLLTPEEIAGLHGANERQARELGRLRARLATLEAARAPVAGSHAPPGAPRDTAVEEETAPTLPAAPLTASPAVPLMASPAVPSAARQAPVTGPTMPSSMEDVSRRRRAARRSWRLRLVALLLGVVAAVVFLQHILNPMAPAATRTAAPRGLPARAQTTTRTAVIPLAGVPLVARQTLGDTVGLLAPRAAAALPNGYIAVLDAGNRRVALLDGAGRLVRSEQAGALRDPTAIVSASDALYVLDAGRGAIERYDTSGRFVREVVRDGALRGGSGMALGRHGLLYVANPGLDRIVVVGSVDGKIGRAITGGRGTGGAGGDRFTRPVDVAMGKRGLYVLDGTDGHIVALTPAGTIAAQWPPAAPSTISAATTMRPGRLMALPDGRLLVSGPPDAVLVYAADDTLPVFQRAVTLPNDQGRVLGALGLSSAPRGDLLVTDTAGNRVLLMPAPR